MRGHLMLQRPHLLQRKFMNLLIQLGLHGRIGGAQIIHRLDNPLHLLHPLGSFIMMIYFSFTLS